MQDASYPLVSPESPPEFLNQPILRPDLFPDPILVESMDLLHFKGNFICRVRCSQGIEGISVSNNMQMNYCYPMWERRIKGFFVGKDARNWESLLEEFYDHFCNYKFQGLALWVPLATAEFAVLDLLGKHAGVPMGELFGPIQHSEVAVYQANNYRGKSAEESVELMKAQVDAIGANALKCKVGGRMNQEDSPPGRSEALIPLARETFGPDMTLYADANSSYDVKNAIRIGKLLEEYDFAFFEEPVPFDAYPETKTVSDALKLPIAGGEQESSMRIFRGLIEQNILDIVQPDLFYFGGMVRSMQIARLAHAHGKICTPHISESGLGYVYMLHFVSALPNAGPFHEFKAFNPDLPFQMADGDLQVREGILHVPRSPGSGIILDPAYLAKHHPVSSSL
jgi:L-alanine-DL-glutamate epimerase-like enolase superfamily enzyme